MILRPLLIASLFLIPAHSYACEPKKYDPFFFKTENLRDENKARTELVTKHNAKLFTCKTQDNLTIHGTFIPRKKNADHANRTPSTVIVASGFFPGRQWGMATLTALIPDYNIVLFDARGKGDSEGPFWRKVKRYGKREYQDVIAVMNYVKTEHPQEQLLMYGLCAGAFHTIRALEILQAENKLEPYNVRAIVLDSAFTACPQVIAAGDYHLREKVFTPFIQHWFFPHIKNKKVVQQTILCKAFLQCVGNPLVKLLTSYAKEGINEHNEKTRIDTNIKTLQKIPILGLHAADDKYVECQHVKDLLANHENPNDELCILRDSSHADNLLKHPELCAIRINNFFEKIDHP